MASSQPPTSSPARSATSPERFELSPQSRLRKLLATVDSDSDDDTSRTTARKPQLPRQISPFPKSVESPAAYASGEDDDELVVRPRGRLAARMQGGIHEESGDARERVKKSLDENAINGQAANVEMADTNEEDIDSDGDVIARPRGRLAARMQEGSSDENIAHVSDSPAKTPAPGQLAGDGQDVEMADDDEDEDIPLRAGKLHPRHRNNTTPEPTTSQQESSPGLFVTPSKPPPSAQESPATDSGSNDDLPAIKSKRFEALVQKKRQERLAREAEEARKKQTRAAALEELGDDNDDDVSDITDDDGGRKLTQRQQKARPSRKASKKAVEEMNRETQRMQRAMQLAHEAKTKKKIAKASLFERFNFNPSGNAPVNESSSRPQTPVSVKSLKSTDAEMQDAGTPPSSPPARVEDVLGKDLTGVQARADGAGPTTSSTTNMGSVHIEDNDLPDIMDLQAFARKPLDKGKGKATTPDLGAQAPAKPAPKRQVRVKLPLMQTKNVSLGSDDDDELVIVNPKNKLDAIFDRIPTNKARESKSLRLLRQLAHLDSPERKAHKKTDKSAMTPGELQAHLQQRAREQAKLERERRLEMLKAKGIHIQTEEERERDREQVEDMVARARREAEEIMSREREEAKKEKKAKGHDPLAWDDSGSDDDFEEEPEEADDEGEEAGVELSGSEEEDNDQGMIIDGDDEKEEATDAEAEATPKKTSAVHAMVDEAAGEASENDGEASETEQSWIDPDEEEEKHRWGAASDDDLDQTPAFVQARRPKKPLAIVSDDEDLEVEATPKPLKTHSIDFTPRQAAVQGLSFTPGPNKNTSPEVPTSVLRSAAKTFIPGLPVDAGGPAGLGLTQIFAGTMDDSQAGPLLSPSQPMPTFDYFPDSQFSQNVAESSDAMILESQTVPATQAETQSSEKETQIRLDFTQSQTHGLDSLLRDDLATQPSQLIDPTQDGGFQDWTPLKERFVEPSVSTVGTVIQDTSPVEAIPHESPLLQKRGRLRRKAAIASDSEDEGVNVPTQPTVFNVMKDAAAKEKRRKEREEFNKKKSKAKEMVHEQAEESEDEYAGLGGVDGEDSDDDDLASVQEMIDDQTQGNKLDELKIAALHAERARAEDAKQTDKLFNDITMGMLRRKRGADYDLSDSDDGGEARKRMKRRQFAKMQKALYADERVSKVAENPRNQAFMRTIEDIGSDEEMDFLLEPAPQAGNTDSQSTVTGTESQEQTVPDSQPTAAAAAQRPPAAERRTKMGHKPTNLGEIRQTLSNLLDEPSGNTVISATDFGSDSESHAEGSDQESSSSNKENGNPRRHRHVGAVVDRISLKRQGSSNVSTGGGGRMAFAAASSAAANGGFKVPALLRKATTNSLTSTGSTGSSGPAAAAAAAGNASGGGFGDEGKIKKNAGKRSGVSFLARENERRTKLVEAEKRREEKKFRAVEGRSKVVAGLFGAGKFE